MSVVRSSLESVLKVRMHERDRQQLVLAALQSQDAACEAQQADRLRSRGRIQGELRALTDRGRRMSLDALAARRAESDRLTDDLHQIASRRTVLAGQLELARAALLHADQAVRALEKLLAEQAARQHAAHEQRERQELEENWQARQAIQNSACFGVRG
jgi:hypothetical protein